jgi:hypothetical protein
MARQSIAATALLKGAAAALVLAQLPAHAAESSTRFDIAVTLRVDTPPEFGACKAGEVLHPQGIAATVTCSPVPGPTPTDHNKTVVSSVVFHISRGAWLGTADESMGLGTVTSWRVIHLANRDYLEMMVGW